MDLSTILKIIVGFLSFVISAFLIKSEWSDIKFKNKISSKNISIFLLILIMGITTWYTVLDGYNVSESNNKAIELNKTIDSISIELKFAKKDREDILSNLLSSNLKLKEIKNSLDPFLVLAIKKYPETDTIIALKRLYNEMNEMKKDIVEISLQSEFKKIEQSLSDQIISDLKKSVNLKECKIVISDWTGSTINQQVAKEINDIFNMAGVSSIIENSFGMQGGYIPSPIEINVDPDNIEASDEFIKIFKTFFYDYQPKPRPKKGMGLTIRIRIFGNPSFKMDGRIKYN
jgi:hypothetical protein